MDSPLIGILLFGTRRNITGVTQVEDNRRMVLPMLESGAAPPIKLHQETKNITLAPVSNKILPNKNNLLLNKVFCSVLSSGSSVAFFTEVYLSI